MANLSVGVLLQLRDKAYDRVSVSWRENEGNETIKQSEFCEYTSGAWTSERGCHEGPWCKIEKEREKEERKIDRYMITKGEVEKN